MRVPFSDLESVVRAWAASNGFKSSAVHVDGEDRVRLESDRGRVPLAIDVFALDGFGNVAVDFSGPGGVRHAYTGPAPDLPRLLDEALRESEASAAPARRDLN